MITGTRSGGEQYSRHAVVRQVGGQVTYIPVFKELDVDAERPPVRLYGHVLHSDRQMHCVELDQRSGVQRQ
jgi:hypothetical protein